MAAQTTRTPNPAQPLKVSPSRGWKFWLRKLLLSTLAALLLGLALVLYTNLAPVWAARGKVFSEVSDVPETRVGLVFGTTDRVVGGRENLYFRYRIEAASKLWKSGKLRTIIVSGDNRRRSYNEPEKMRQALIQRGIPAKRIVCDYAGLRTLDSVVRAKEIFGVESIVFISQRFQNERAIYLARANGIQAWGFDARDVASHGGLKTKVREVGARVKMWLDVHVLHTQPKFLGEKIALPE